MIVKSSFFLIKPQNLMKPNWKIKHVLSMPLRRSVYCMISKRWPTSSSSLTKERVVLCIRMPYPLMQTFKKWIVADMLKVMPKSRTTKALSYIYNINHKLTRYHLNGKQKIDNNNNGVYLKVLINWLKMHSVR